MMQFAICTTESVVRDLDEKTSTNRRVGIVYGTHCWGPTLISVPLKANQSPHVIIYDINLWLMPGHMGPVYRVVTPLDVEHQVVLHLVDHNFVPRNRLFDGILGKRSGLQGNVLALKMEKDTGLFVDMTLADEAKTMEALKVYRIYYKGQSIHVAQQRGKNLCVRALDKLQLGHY
ncbi:hypothetical protein EDD18DRAFT_1100986 [Armillaria luteobubalina]|uniref:Uncharacterized protein n=1 Tax=Armillaria luteobubalina TaxID=153913 RepID=A0AA39QGN6_9AGAR|nr:hypothetical protein EDD18DRAFT_1100986 [Armillaria luteobubalina]